MPAWARIAAIALALLPGVAAAQMAELVSKTAFRVCADPSNDPMSTQDGTGFENKIADLIAAKLEKPVEYTWFPMATGFVRRTLRANECDVIIGFAQGHEMVQNTNHYMTSAYTIVFPKDSPLADVTTISDPRLKGKTLGIIAGSPPGNHMARQGLMALARPYPLLLIAATPLRRWICLPILRRARLMRPFSGALSAGHWSSASIPTSRSCR
ncbi:extracellular solute-binding protein, family 3 [Roseovarius marisflavi]|uniref:Extracellular solute-binding protein, family 3 n=1 Tax=Roseovarius marisflavi TaxID=1054996 RepID=A0A1M7DFF5_9RHOB|nr:extracellular solute-binding protein, family 3 [Roseovarius marisflavi]